MPETSKPSDMTINQVAVVPEGFETTFSEKPLTGTVDETYQDGHCCEEPLTPEGKKPLRKRVMSLEVPMFLLLLSLMLSTSVMTNQELYQTCIAVYNYNESSCEPLRGIIPKTQEAKIIENHIQPYVAKIRMANIILQNVWPGILVLFVGPWSDKFGRRPIILLSLSAAVLNYVLIAILIGISEIFALNPWFYLLGEIPSTLAGGSCTLVTIVSCYVADVSNEKNMPKRMFYVEVAAGMGALLGGVMSSYMLNIFSVSSIFLTSAVLLSIALLYVYFYIGESLHIEETSFWHKAKQFFDIRLIRDLIVTIITRRPNYGRAIITFIICISMISNFVHYGEYGVFYLFLRNKFNITLRQYTYYNAIVIIIKIIGCAVSLSLFRKLLKLSCGAVCLLSLIGAIMNGTTKALAQSFWHIYLAATFAFMSGITNPMLQSIVKMNVSSREIGKVFSLTSFFQTLTPLVASPLYTIVYNNTLHFYPGFFNFISAGLLSACFLCMVLVFFFERRANERLKDSKLDTEETDNLAKKMHNTNCPNV